MVIRKIQLLQHFLQGFAGVKNSQLLDELDVVAVVDETVEYETTVLGFDVMENFVVRGQLVERSSVHHGADLLVEEHVGVSTALLTSSEALVLEVVLQIPFGDFLIVEFQPALASADVGVIVTALG